MQRSTLHSVFSGVISHGITLVDTAIQHEDIMCTSVLLLIKDTHHVFIIHNTAIDLQVLGFLKIYLF